MKLTVIILLLLLCLLVSPFFTFAAPLRPAASDTIPGKDVYGYRQQMAAGTREAATFFAKAGFENEAYKIILPPELQVALDTLANTQFAALGETFRSSLNRCAAKLVEYIAPDFIKSAKRFKPEDAVSGSNGYTAYVAQFKLYASDYLTATAFAYETHLLETTGTLSAYRKMTGAYNGLFMVRNKLNFVLEGFLSGIAVDTIFKFLLSNITGTRRNS
jgi:Protein of unknown function (DUF4197)